MKKRIRAYLYDEALLLATKTFSSMSDQNRISTLIMEEKEYTVTLIEKLIHLIADTIVSEDEFGLVDNVRELANKRAEDSVPIQFAMERIRGFRQSLLQSFKEYATTYIETIADWHQFYDIQRQIYEYVDIIVFTYVQSYTNLEKEKDNQQELVVPQTDPRLTEVVEQELVQLVLQSSDIAVIMVDRKLRIIEANQALAELLNVQRESIIGGHIDEMFRPRTEERYIQWVIEREESGHYVAEFNGKWTTVSTSPIYHAGELWGAIAVLRNISENKRFEEELTKREALAAVGQLAASMAHEIRNPLTSIKGFIQLLREQVFTEKSESYFSVILMEIERIDGLLNDVLVLARYRDDQIEAERFQVMEEVNGVIRLLEPEANRRGIRLEINNLVEGLFVNGYRSRIKQVILNLLKNSLEALSTKGSFVKVSVDCTLSQVVIIVEDDGPGLSEEVKQNLFVPFFTTKSDGTGLGLSTTNRIVVDHGGEIFADNSLVCGGARFEVRLPISD